MPIPITTRTKTTRHGGLLTKKGHLKRRFKEASKVGFAAVGEYWHQHILPDHFERGNRRRYGYTPRTIKHDRRKRELARRGKVVKGGEVDNVYTGFMEETMERFATVRAFPTRARVRVQAPRYMTFRPRGNQPDKFRELSTVNKRQLQKLEKIHQTTTEKALKR